MLDGKRSQQVGHKFKSGELEQMVKAVSRPRFWEDCWGVGSEPPGLRRLNGREWLWVGCSWPVNCCTVWRQLRTLACCSESAQPLGSKEIGNWAGFSWDQGLARPIRASCIYNSLWNSTEWFFCPEVISKNNFSFVDLGDWAMLSCAQARCRK